MNKELTTSDLLSRLDSVDALSSEPRPAGWSRRNWVQREKIALDAMESGNAHTREDLA